MTISYKSALQKEGGSSPSPPPMATTPMANSLHDDLSTSSPRLNKDEEMLELISDPKSAVSLFLLLLPLPYHTCM
jgi:hypothetical protein